MTLKSISGMIILVAQQAEENEMTMFGKNRTLGKQTQWVPDKNFVLSGIPMVASRYRDEKEAEEIIKKTFEKFCDLNKEVTAIDHLSAFICSENRKAEAIKRAGLEIRFSIKLLRINLGYFLPTREQRYCASIYVASTAEQMACC